MVLPTMTVRNDTPTSQPNVGSRSLRLFPCDSRLRQIDQAKLSIASAIYKALGSIPGIVKRMRMKGHKMTDIRQWQS